VQVFVTLLSLTHNVPLLIFDCILRLLLFLTSLAWRCENLFAHQSSPSPSHFPHHCPFAPVEPGYGVGLVEDDYLFLLPAADLRMDPAVWPRPVSSVAFAYLGNALQLDHLIERRYIYSPSVFRCDIRSTTPIGICFSILPIPLEYGKFISTPSY
jgi:hypothetical protein